jgi:hypothetical protein
VSIPPSGDTPERKGLLPGVDLPFQEGFVEPSQLIHLALTRRSGIEITRVYGFMERDYNKWLDAGRPPRTYRGTLREDD